MNLPSSISTKERVLGWCIIISIFEPDRAKLIASSTITLTSLDFLRGAPPLKMLIIDESNP